MIDLQRFIFILLSIEFYLGKKYIIPYIVLPCDSLLFFKLNVVQMTESESKRVRWKLVPTRREQEKWDRATKAATGGNVSNW